jgi:tRNA A58 N-methylase Trm61
MKNSLSSRLIYRIMAVVMAMMAIITGVVYVTVREYMLDEAKQRYESVLLDYHEELRRHLADIYIAAQNNVHDIEHDIDHPERMTEHMVRILKKNPGHLHNRV